MMTENVWYQLLSDLLPLGREIVMVLVGVLLVPWLRGLAKSKGMEISDAHEEAIRRVALDAVAWAEEQGHKALKGKLSGEDKLGLARDRLRRELQAVGGGDLSKDRLDELLETTLGHVRAERGTDAE